MAPGTEIFHSRWCDGAGSTSSSARPLRRLIFMYFIRNNNSNWFQQIKAELRCNGRPSEKRKKVVIVALWFKVVICVKYKNLNKIIKI